MLKRLAASVAVCVSLLSIAAQAQQNVFVLPGSASTTATVLPFSGQYVPINAGLTAGAGAFKVIAKPDGTEYYVISASSSQTVTTVDPGFQNPKALASLGAPATTASLTANGKYLLVVAGGSLYIINTATDTQVNTTGITVPNGPIVDLALSLDGSQAFALSSTTDSAGNAKSALYSLDPATGAVVATLAITNIVTGVAVGPNDLVYVSGTNRIYEINPATLAYTSGGQIALNAKAGKVGFTPDGRYALVLNQTPGQTGAALFVIDLVLHTVATTGSNLGNSILDSILVASNSTAFAYSGNTASVYQLTIPNLNISGIQFASVPTLNISAAALSPETAEGINSTPVATATSPKTAHYLYLLASGNIYRVDLTTNQLAGQFPVSIQQPEAISVTGPQVTGSPATVLQYGSKQNVAMSAVSEPLVIRALDSTGSPLSGVPVTFASTTAGAVIKNASVTTGANGYALTTVTVPAANVQVTVTATVGTQTLTFGLTVGNGSGGSGGTQAGALTITAGQGQVFLAGFGSSTGNGQPFTVLATDANGKPLSGVVVTFEPVVNNLNANPGAAGSLVGATSGMDGGATKDGFGRTVTTDAKGLAGVNFQPNSQVNFSLIQASFLASSPNINSVTFYVTVAPATGSPAVHASLLPGDLVTGQAGATVKNAVSIAVATEQGTPISNVAIQAIEPPASVGQTGPTGSGQVLVPSKVASCADITGNGVLTDQMGNVSCNLIIKALPGNYQFSINVGNYIIQGPYNLKVLPGSPTSVTVISGDAQTGNAGQALPLPFVVQINDAAGNPLAGQPVTFQPLTNNTLTLSAVSAVTDANGRASAQGTLGTAAPGPYHLKVTATGIVAGPTATLTYNITVPLTGIAISMGNNQTTAVSTAFAIPAQVIVNDANGPVAGVTVTFSASNGATLSASSVTTDAMGRASTIVTAGPVAGSITVTASAPGGFITSFSLTSAPPGPMSVTFVNGASFQPGIAPGAIAVIRGVGLLPGFTGLFNAAGIVGPLPTSITDGALSGLSVTFNGVAAPIFYASNQNGSEQIAVQVPYETPVGMAETVVINTPGGGSGTFTVAVQAAAPGVFQTQYNGMSFAVAIRQSDGSYISPSNPAHVGDVVCIFATGLGQTTPPLTTNSNGVATATVASAMDVGLNNAGVRLVSATPSPDEVGVFTVCMNVPAGTATGPRQPVGIVVHTTPGVSSGDYFGNSTYIPIQ